jgi:hypothetical protein
VGKWKEFHIEQNEVKNTFLKGVTQTEEQSINQLVVAINNGRPAKMNKPGRQLKAGSDSDQRQTQSLKREHISGSISEMTPLNHMQGNKDQASSGSDMYNNQKGSRKGGRPEGLQIIR